MSVFVRGGPTAPLRFLVCGCPTHVRAPEVLAVDGTFLRDKYSWPRPCSTSLSLPSSCSWSVSCLYGHAYPSRTCPASCLSLLSPKRRQASHPRAQPIIAPNSKQTGTSQSGLSVVVPALRSDLGAEEWEEAGEDVMGEDATMVVCMVGGVEL